MFKALTVPGFRWLWTGQLLSQFGNAVFLVMGLWEIQLKNPVLLSVAGVAMMVPQILSAFGGVIVDRHDPRRLMLWTDLVRGIAVLLGILLLVLNPDWEPWLIIGLLAVNSLGVALFGPAEGAVIPTLVADEQLPSANGLYSLTYQLSSAIGTGIGGAAIAVVGVTMVFGFDLGSFWFSALAILLMIRRTAHVPRPKTGSNASFAQGFTEGWKALARFRWFILLMPIVVLTNFTFAGAFVLLPYWMHHHLGANAVWYGLTDAAWAAGTVVGSLASGALARLPLGRVAGTLGILQALMMGAFAVVHSAPAAASLLLVAGMANGTVNALMFTLLQRAIPANLRGRAFGVLMSVLTIASPLAAVCSGLSLGVVPLVSWYAAAAITGGVLGVQIWLAVPNEGFSSLIDAGGETL